MVLELTKGHAEEIAAAVETLQHRSETDFLLVH